MVENLSNLDMSSWQQHLQGLNDEIDRCVGNAEWERLAEILDARRLFLERLSSIAGTFSDQQNLVLKQCLEMILVRDEAFISIIEEQKRLFVNQQSILERGKKAVTIYNSY